MPRKRGFIAKAIQSEFIDMGRLYDMVSVTAEASRAQLIGEQRYHVGQRRSATMRIKLIGRSDTTSQIWRYNAR